MGTIDERKFQSSRRYDVEEQVNGSDFEASGNHSEKQGKFSKSYRSQRLQVNSYQNDNIQKPNSPPPAPPLSSTQSRRYVEDQSDYGESDEDDLENGVGTEYRETRHQYKNETVHRNNELQKNNFSEDINMTSIDPNLLQTVGNPILNPQEGTQIRMLNGTLSTNSNGQQVLQIKERKPKTEQQQFIKKQSWKCCSCFNISEEKEKLRYEDSLIKVVRQLLTQGDNFVYSIDFITIFTVLNFGFSLVALCSETDGYFIGYNDVLESSATFLNVYIGWDRYMMNFNGGAPATVRYISDISNAAYGFGCMTFLGLVYSLWLSIFLSWILFNIYRNNEILPMFTVLRYRYFEFFSRSFLGVSFYLFLFGMLCYGVLIPQDFEIAFAAAGYDNFVVQTIYGYGLLTLLTLSQFLMGIFLSFYAKKLDILIEESATSIRQLKKIEYDRLLVLKEEEQKKTKKKEKRQKQVL